MSHLISALDKAISTIDRFKKHIGRLKIQQLRSAEDQNVAKATAYAWIKTQRPKLKPLNNATCMQATDLGFQQLLEFADRATSISKYQALVKKLRGDLIKLRSESITLINSDALDSDGSLADIDFSRLINDNQMQNILIRRWKEIKLCIGVEAHLAATVMIGALLEALLLARINRMPDQGPIYKLEATPKDQKGKVRLLKEWTLKDLIDVAHEINWIRRAARDISIVLRDYRNYIHPEKERRHGLTDKTMDSKLFAVLLVSLADQISNSV